MSFVLSLILSRQSWDAKSIQGQDIDTDGTKYAPLEGRRDVPGEASTYAFFIPAGTTNTIGTAPMRGSPSSREL